MTVRAVIVIIGGHYFQTGSNRFVTVCLISRGVTMNPPLNFFELPAPEYP